MLISPSLERLPTKFNKLFVNAAHRRRSCDNSCCFYMNSVWEFFLSRRAIVPNSIAIFQKRTYICKIYFSKELLETLNLKVFNKFSLDQDFSDINLTWSSQLPVFGKKDPGAYGKKYSLSLYIHKEGRVKYRITLARD